MSNDSQLQVTPKSGNALSLSNSRSSLIFRGRMDALALTIPEADSEAGRTCFFDVVFADLMLDSGTTEEDAANGDAKRQYLFGLGSLISLSPLVFFGQRDARQQYFFALRSSLFLGEVSSRHVDAVNSLCRAADQAYAPALFSLGWLYDSGRFDAPNLVEGAKLYRMAADQDYAPAQFNLGSMYDNGDGVPQDHAEAARWYRKAADHGLREAQFNLGLKYDKGQGVVRDYAKTAYWFSMATDRNHSAQFNLGLKYESGQGVTQDYVQAYMWINVAEINAGKNYKEKYGAARDRVASRMTPTQILDAILMGLSHLPPTDPLERESRFMARIQAAAKQEREREEARRPPPLPPIRL